jgi:hypothetical protein
VIFNCETVIQGMREASRRSRIPATPSSLDAARRARLAAGQRSFPSARWRD